MHGLSFILRLKRYLSLGLFFILLLSGCAHKGGTDTCKIISPPTQPVASAQSAQDRVRGGVDDFFEDEFSTNLYLVADPLAPINRVVFQFNDKLYFWCLKPVALGYRFVIPEPIRLGIGNMFFNVAGIGRMANNLLQGKFRSAGAEFGRFFVNSTAGLLGLGNPAANFPALNPEPEDMGQTLGAWGIDNGFYLVLPIYGPSTLRDAIGIVGDWLFYPASYLRPWYIPISYRAVELTNRLSFHIGDYEAVKDSALDPYLMFRSAYIQTRQKMVER